MNEKKEYETLFDKLREILIQKDKLILKLEQENFKLIKNISELETKNKVLSEKVKYNFDNIENDKEINNLILSEVKEINRNKIDLQTIESNTNSTNFKNINTIISHKLKENENLLEKYENFDSSIKKMKISTENYNTNEVIQKEMFYIPPAINAKSSKNDDKSQTQSKMNDSTTSRVEIKFFLQEVKEKISPKNFKQFISYIKILTDKNGVVTNRSEIFENVKSLFGIENKELYLKFEQILSIKN